MKKFIHLIALLAISQYAFANISPDIAIQLLQDTTVESVAAHLTWGSNQQSVDASRSGLGISTVSDKNIFHNNAGLSVINALRGQSANINLGGTSLSPGGMIRGRAPIFVVDGFSYGYPISQSINFNTFEYEQISISNSPNASLGYANTGLGSVISLKSKTGVGYTRPQFEFNTYSTYGYYHENLSFGGSSGEKVEKWIFNNALAYSQDFGMVDTRISYAFTTSPAHQVGYNFKTRNHAIRINTGFNFSEKFSARLILDDNYDKTFYDELESKNEVYSDVEGKSHEETLRANLSLEYRPSNWFRLNVQGGINRIKGNSNTMNSYIVSTSRFLATNALYQHQQGKFANVFATFSPTISENVSLNTFVGLQLEGYKPMRSTTQMSVMDDQVVSSSWQRNHGEADLTTFLSGLGLNVHDVLLLDLNYRTEDISSERFDTYGATTSFLFGNAFGWTGGGFSSSKLRVGVAKSALIQNTRYPYSWEIATNDLSPSGGNNIEGGIDFGFIDNRIGLSVTAFNFTRDKNFTYIYGPGPWNGGQYYFIDLGKTSTRGWEIVANATAVRTENFQYATKISWGKSKMKFENEPYNGISSSSSPDWTMGFLNQLNTKHFYFSFLIDFVHGGDITTLTAYPGYEIVKIDGDLTRLRDVTFGYNYQSKALSKFGVREFRVSLIGRNLWTIYEGNKDYNSEDYQNPTGFLKTTSLSATFVF